MWGHGRFASVGCVAPDERVRGRQTQRVILPEPTGSTEIRHPAPREHAVHASFDLSRDAGPALLRAPRSRARVPPGSRSAGPSCWSQRSSSASRSASSCTASATPTPSSPAGASTGSPSRLTSNGRSSSRTGSAAARSTAPGRRCSSGGPSGEATFGSWHWLATFDTGDGHLTFRCHGAHGATRIAALPSVGMVFSTLLFGDPAAPGPGRARLPDPAGHHDPLDQPPADRATAGRPAADVLTPPPAHTRPVSGRAEAPPE